MAQDIPFVLEVVCYPLEEGSTDTPEYARQHPEWVVGSAREFSRLEYQVDVLKLEFPADLKYSQEYCRGVFDGKVREPIYDMAQVGGWCARLEEACAMPWVILSGGVDIEQFLVNLQQVMAAGASGFLCGRALWKDAVGLYPDMQKMESFLESEGASNFKRANALADKALPWYRHRRFSEAEGVQVAAQGIDWYRTYGTAASSRVAS